MAQSYKNRLNGDLPQFLEDVKRHGIWEAMERWELKDYISVRKLILEETGDENLGARASPYHSEGIKGVFRDLVSAFADYVIRKEKREEELRRRLEAYETNGKGVERDFADEMLGLIEAMKEVK